MEHETARFRQTFLDEAAELCGELEGHLLALERDPGDQERLDALFRCAHSLKGGSGAFGFVEMAHLTHALEELLEGVRGRQVSVDQSLIDLLLRSVDTLKRMVAGGRGGRPQVNAAGALVSELAERCGAEYSPHSEPRSPNPDPRLYEIRFEPDPLVFHRGLDPVQVLKAVAEAGEVVEAAVDLSMLPPLAEMDPERCYLAWRLRVRSADRKAIEGAFEFVREGSVVSITDLPDPAQTPNLSIPHSASRTPHSESSTIRVATEKVDRLVNLVGELVISQSMVSEIVAGFSGEKFTRLQEAAAQMSRHSRELQEHAMALRMIPSGTLFARFPRLVRDIAARSGKAITLQISGEETELDKAVIELMADPLTHLVRNAADHGIEPPGARAEAGKPAEGAIRLSAYQEGGRIVLEVEDDGQGLDRERILRKAVTEGLVGETAELSDEEVWALIFRPGFSTSEEVSELSGRGVGMDVVRKNVEALGGSISVRTRAGHGTRFTIRLPLTMAILEGQCLGVGEQVFILPLVAIVESVQPRRGEVKPVIGRGEAFHFRGEFVPVIRLHALFGIPSTINDPAEGILVVAESEGRKVALLGDDLLGQQQVVLKSLETNFRKVEGIAAATILGDGRVALILDVPGLIRLAGNTQGRREETKLSDGVGGEGVPLSARR